MTPTHCAVCGKALTRRQIHQVARCCSWACDRVRRPPVVMHCATCGRELTASQRKYAKARGDSYCRLSCKEAAPDTPTCEHCGRPLGPSQIRGKYRYCSLSCSSAARTHRPAEYPAPAPSSIAPAPQEPAQRVEGAILGREGGYTYTVNGAWVSRAGMGRTIAEWERLRNWGPSLPAYRRCHTPLPVVLPMGAEPVTAWGKRRVEEVEG